MILVRELHHRSSELRKVLFDQIGQLVAGQNRLLLKNAHISPCIYDLGLDIPICSVAKKVGVVVKETRRTHHLSVACTLDVHHLRRLGAHKHDKAVLTLLLSHERQACKKCRQYEHQGFTHHLRIFSYQPLRSKSQSLNSGSIMI